MKEGFLFARSNIRKSRGQTISIIVLTLLASVCLNLWLMLASDYKANFNRYHDKLNAEHITLSVYDNSDTVKKDIIDILEKTPEVTQYAIDNCLTSEMSFDYSGGNVYNNVAVITKDIALNRFVGKLEIIEEGNITSGVYLPMLYGTDEKYQIGKTIEIAFSGQKRQYVICGFFNSVMTGSHNCSICTLILTNDKYEQLASSSDVTKGMLVSIRINDRKNSEQMAAYLSDQIALTNPGISFSSNSYAIVSSSRYISQMICSGIVSAMAFIVILISLVVIFSGITNYIHENMRNLGVLKAVGYTSRQLIVSLLGQFLSISLLGVLLGIILSYGIFPFINKMMISQTGIPYEVRILILPIVLTILIISAFVSCIVWLASKKIKKIEPIVALRQGVKTHSFNKNYFPLDKTKTSLSVSLALKTTMSNKKNTITTSITMIVLSLVLVFSGLMHKNVISDMQPFIDLIVGEVAESSITVDVTKEEEFYKLVSEDSRVEKLYLYNSAQVSHKDGISLVATMCDDFTKVNNSKVCIEGRFPKFDNEVVLAAKYARENDLKIGDEITLSADGVEEKYIITGFSQISNNLGRDCLLTRSGYEKMGKITSACYYINIVDGVDIDEFNNEIKQQLTDGVVSILNLEKIIIGTGSVYVSLSNIIVVAILILSVIIIAFVLYLLVRTFLNKKKDYGIMKAVGYTTKQLILQTALSFMPAIILSTIIGVTISLMIINPLIALFLGGLGVVKCTFELPIIFTVIGAIALIGFSFVLACLMSLRIKKISPIKLLVNE